VGHGVGIADDEKGKIFSPYYRPELAWKIDSAGHGLGLAVVARCAKLMKVKYGMQSIEGKGSRFWMRFTQYAGEEIAPDIRPPLTTPPRRYAMRRCAVPAWSSMTTRW
jgi:K+-sensing histidine kinase KdpD